VWAPCNVVIGAPLRRLAAGSFLLYLAALL
jgi:hypothetical protein